MEFSETAADDTTGIPEWQLYDLCTDPGEKTNLVAEHPERVAKLKAMMEEVIRRGRSTPGPELKNDVEIVMIKPVPAAKAKGKEKK